uniref:Uncharacterized protein n=1 Tax=Fagus sylvatica TaxID=28930 RepID=A0A2N9HIF2_FAGSY
MPISSFISFTFEKEKSLFWGERLGFAEGNLGPPPLEGYVSSDSVLHRLAAELYSIVHPALTTWEAVRNRMAANEAEWSLPLSEELPEGLSDESAGGEVGRASSDAVPSTSGSRQMPRVNRSWKALSFFSKIRRDEDINRIRRSYQIPDDVVLRIPDSDERACCPKYEGDVAFYEADFKAGLRFPVQPFVRELLDYLSFGAGANKPKRLADDHLLHGYNRDVNSRVVQGLPSSDRIWKDGYFFVCGDNWERLPQEGPRDFVGVRRTWGTPSSSALDRPLLNSVWQERIWRILEIEDRRYNIFIEPDFLATFSLGPVPSINTMKLNKSRLKQMAQSGEVAAAPISLKRKKPDEGSSKRAEEAPSRPSAPIATPPVIPTAVPSGQRDPPVILGLTEAMVMARRCASVEEDLALLRAKSNCGRGGDEECQAGCHGADEERGKRRWASEAFEDINTRYFLSGFEAFRKQAVQRFPGLDFSALQPYDDEGLGDGRFSGPGGRRGCNL